MINHPLPSAIKVKATNDFIDLSCVKSLSLSKEHTADFTKDGEIVRRIEKNGLYTITFEDLTWAEFREDELELIYTVGK